MTVADLIRALSALPQDAAVGVEADDDWHEPDVHHLFADLVVICPAKGLQILVPEIDQHAGRRHA